MDTSEERLAAVEAEWRAKYSTADREKLAKEGKALSDGSYPIVDKEDLTNAATLAASGHGDVEAAKALIRKRAKELGVDVESLPGFGKESKAAEQWDAEHRSGPSHNDTRHALEAAIRDLPEAGKLSAYLHDFDDDTAMYESGGKMFQVPYTMQDDGSAKLGDPKEVQAKTTYHPVESKSVRRKERRRAVPLMPEVRHWAIQPTSVEIRTGKSTDEAVITGSPIVYNADYSVFDMFGEFTERMASGVCSEVLKRGVDTRFLFNHDGLSLARTTSGTMTLQDGERSLDFEAHLDMRQQLSNDLVIAIERKDITQMSCGFIVARDEWDEAMEDRTVLQFSDLLDVSAVTYPASPTTSIQIAQRMAMEMPVESRARLRNFIVAERAGKTLSGANSGKVVSAIEALHALYEAGGGDPADLIDGGESDETALSADGTRSEDGEPIRSTKASTLRLQLEARSKKRKRLKAA